MELRVSPSRINIELDSRDCKTPESLSGCHSPRSPGSPVGDDACPICLAAFTDKCAAASCLHHFCLVCLKEWSKQRPVCPLCKQSFTKILYDIKSESDYKEWKVPPPTSQPNLDLEIRGFTPLFFDPLVRRFFRYRSTFMRRRSHIDPSTIDAILPPGRPRRRRIREPSYNDRGSSLFRLSIYSNDVWVQNLSSVAGRYRESSPALYREQPALTHRLVPWVNRELLALVSESRVGVVLCEIMDLIERFQINSADFRRAIRPHFGARAAHFAHEFYHFACSPYDMVGHDNAATYLPRTEIADLGDEDYEESDDDEVVEVLPLDLTTRGVAHEETVAQDGSYVVISSDSDFEAEGGNNQSLLMLSPLLERAQTFLNSARVSEEQASLRRVSQERETISRPARSLEFEQQAGPSGVSSGSSVKRENSNSDVEECFIVNELKPKSERSPEVIHVSSESDDDTDYSSRVRPTTSRVSQETSGLNKRCRETETRQSKRRRLQLDRTSFSLHVSATLNCQPRSGDHNYCTESASPLPSTASDSVHITSFSSDSDYSDAFSRRDTSRRRRETGKRTKSVSRRVHRRSTKTRRLRSTRPISSSSSSSELNSSSSSSSSSSSDSSDSSSSSTFDLSNGSSAKVEKTSWSTTKSSVRVKHRQRRLMSSSSDFSESSDVSTGGRSRGTLSAKTQKRKKMSSSHRHSAKKTTKKRKSKK